MIYKIKNSSKSIYINTQKEIEITNIIKECASHIYYINNLDYYYKIRKKRPQISNKESAILLALNLLAHCKESNIIKHSFEIDKNILYDISSLSINEIDINYLINLLSIENTKVEIIFS